MSLRSLPDSLPLSVPLLPPNQPPHHDSPSKAMEKTSALQQRRHLQLPSPLLRFRLLPISSEFHLAPTMLGWYVLTNSEHNRADCHTTAIEEQNLFGDGKARPKSNSGRADDGYQCHP
ncbi:hypothetical protein BLNAU_24056 [Blattamonas nauphoetae]|uniref:Uncharacterized protein n=1 Tax=Blattamonas nauphoetae TaxID=2049346 RepID=A0ABQ9WNH5_9EUKA|nr:hypothetical protein BLNAU_24056 [Blattamonas nauphoetae]